VTRAIALPDPPLADPPAGIVLRPWAPTLADAEALAAAWADPEIAATTRVPDDTSIVAATRWIAREPARRAAGRSLDLVIGLFDGGDAVLGEVGLTTIDRQRRRAEMSWWIAAGHRNRGLAGAAARLLADWALSPSGDFDQVWAGIDPTNAASARVAAAAGLVELGAGGGTAVWARTRPGRADGPPPA
jgi:RimJ/RimL family protein N-acetyltransferase